jgi:hypothetical protein
VGVEGLTGFEHFGSDKNVRGLREKSKRDSSTAEADSFAGAKERKRRRPPPVGMTVLGLASEEKDWPLRSE